MACGISVIDMHCKAPEHFRRGRRVLMVSTPVTETIACWRNQCLNNSERTPMQLDEKAIHGQKNIELHWKCFPSLASLFAVLLSISPYPGTTQSDWKSRW